MHVRVVHCFLFLFPFISFPLSHFLSCMYKCVCNINNVNCHIGPS